MKIIFLNIWYGKMFEPLMEFIKTSASQTDIFCFQEITRSLHIARLSEGGRSNMFAELSNCLSEFQGYFVATHSGYDERETVDYNLTHGKAIFVRDTISLDGTGEMFIYKEQVVGPQDIPDNSFPANLQYVRFRRNDKIYTIANVHGIAYPGHKRDTPDRLEQSRRIAAFLAAERGEKILGGDFNLFPDTDSIRMIEKLGMANLIKEFNIKGTRNELCNGLYPESQRQYFADYAFVSPGVHVVNFEAPYCLISDHLPLILDIE